MEAMNLSDDDILAVVKPLAEHTEQAWNEKNYHEFIRYFIEEDPTENFPEDEFYRQIEENYNLHGQHTIADLVAIHRNPDHVIVLWKVDLEKRPEPGLLIYGFREHEGQVFIEGCAYHA
ncbi:hypothetical protein BFW38_11195 [Terasakiispira papahanaumokuakeensis]|uniref:SnoaL-like domain-containing protein n=1 Tax=Terasakiispira papahanaumokuakeensis TaxID=197479 RepID=A0A1E2VAK3_9GAMM|nr:hypothetical protein [Terasakiispira papahanaumokuakeensis]ODC04017.1 hypothetical protein BFW38_11195 [Terasakiispira papahanaumokuakeensis]